MLNMIVLGNYREIIIADILVQKSILANIVEFQILPLGITPEQDDLFRIYDFSDDLNDLQDLVSFADGEVVRQDFIKVKLRIY